MNIKSLRVQVSSDDIKNFLFLQNKVDVKEIIINDTLNIVGEVECLTKKITIESVLSILKVEDNNVYIEVKKVNVFNRNIIGLIFKKVFNYFVQGFTDIKGISFEDDCFKLDANKIIEKYYTEQNIINLKEFEIVNIEICDGHIEITLEGISINTNIIKKDKEEKEIVYAEEEVISEADLETALTVDNIEKYQTNFSESNLFNKIKEYGKSAGTSVIYATLILYYTYKDESVPLSVKAISLGALGYFIIPTDLIPDIILLTGYTDDFIALITAIKSITGYVNDDIRSKARNRIKEWFSVVDEKELEKVEVYL